MNLQLKIETPGGNITGSVKPFYSDWCIDLRYRGHKVLAGNQTSYTTLATATEELVRQALRYAEQFAQERISPHVK